MYSYKMTTFDSMLLLIFFLITTVIFSVKGQCWMDEAGKVNEICRATIYCESTSGDLMDTVTNWSCIKTGNRYYSYDEYHEELETHYDLYLHVRNVDIKISEDPLIQVLDISLHVITLNIEKGNLVTVPIEIESLVNLKELSVTYNKVESLNLRRITAGVAMHHLNVSHNSISVIEDDGVENIGPSLITTIDISYNELESIPDNCFARFTYLEYLDLSCNFIKKLDIFTFEGIAQLKTLQLSNNKISEIGQTFARFKNLQNLSLDYNQLTSLSEINFRNLISLEKLNLSSNLIKQIEDHSFATNRNLKKLDLSHNNMNVINRILFKNNINMHGLSLSYNDITHVDGGSFRAANISFFDIRNNPISGSVEYDTFLGVSVESLDLSNGKLTQLGDKAFTSLGLCLKYLNLSSNSIENVTVSGFQALQNLLKLDLSHNNLTDIEFNTSDLIQLREYYLHNNKIKKVTRNMFKNMTNLVKLDLSHNKIVDIELNSFIELINLEELDISNNNFVKSLIANTFRGLYKVRVLNLSNTRLISCRNESFSGMISIIYLNISHSQLENVEYDTFKATGAIKIIDLSNNKLEVFYLNTSRIPQLKELYLNNNKLNNITSRSFENLMLLEKLNLASNNIFHIDSSSFQSLPHLRYLSLSSNENLQIKSDIFNNMVLSELSLKRVWQQFNFTNVVNTTIATLTLSQCEIENLNSIFIYNIRNVLKLDISLNKIKTLDQDSFKNMIDLNWLDISFNMISTINPGTFSSNHMINFLNLRGNNLEYLQFGVLDGLKNLRVLNLSNNKINKFGINLLHASPSLVELFLENNNLTSLDFKELAQTTVEFLVIGGNNISCDDLAEWNKINIDVKGFKLNVTAATLDFNSENLHGIRCNTFTSRKEPNNINVDIISELTEIKETIGQLYNYLKTSLDKNISNFTTILETSLKYSDKTSANELSASFLDDNKELLSQLVNTSKNAANDNKLIITLIEMNNNLTELGNIHKELWSTRIFNNTIQRQRNPNSTDNSPISHFTQPLEVKLDKSTLMDIKVLLYFIAVCLGIVISFGVISLSYKYLYNWSSRWTGNTHLYDSGQSMRNELEME